MEMARACEHAGFAYTSEDVANIAAKQVSENEVSMKGERKKRQLTERLML